jgi:predicted amino acid-binding ACT domain protein
MNVPTLPAGDVMESVIMQGDLNRLTPEQRVAYYMKTCESLGLNPYTRPFEYLTLNGKGVLYARRDATDQLRKQYNINIEIVSQTLRDGLFTVHVRARDQSGRIDEDVGVVELPDSLKGTLRANTVMRAITKAKRRVTLSITGLGFSDEVELDDIPASAAPPRVPSKPAMNVLLHDPATGEITDEVSAAEDNSQVAAVDAAPSPVDDTPESGGGAALPLEDMAREAAKRGEAVFKSFYRKRTPSEQARINVIGDELRELMGKE